MPLQDLLHDLRQRDALRPKDAVTTDFLDSIRPDVLPKWPPEVHLDVRRALAELGLQHPYKHQVDAVRRSIAGQDVVLESSTASGKTLAFSVPVLDALCRDPRAHALLIYPMKALAFDQRTQLKQIGEKLEVESWPYDGDTPTHEKDALLTKPCQILLTTPDYLNMSFLGHMEKWTKNGFLPKLRYVVIDEMHEYRGYFGSNVALLFRRLFRVLNRIGASPTVFLSTATCANPKEHAKNLTGLDVELVSAGNALRPKRHFVFVKPDIPDFKYLDRIRARVVKAALAFLERGEQVLVFCPSKRFLEGALRHCRGELEERELDPDEVKAFHADIKGETKQDIQDGIRQGDVRIVFTTNALELGIDIGGLDAIILAGFPSTIMSAWQQIGRAGRSWEKTAYVVVYAMNDPMDAFFVTNVKAFLDRPFDRLVVDPSNQDVIDNHVPSLLKELDGDVRSADLKPLGRGFFDTAIKTDSDLPHGYRPQLQLPLRGMYGKSFKLLHGKEEIGNISELRRFREAYIGAIFPFMGQQFRVKAHQAGEVVLEKADVGLRTEPTFFRTLSKDEFFDGTKYGDTLEAYYGSLTISHHFHGYRLVNAESDETLHIDSTKSALYDNRIHAFWLESPEGGDWSAAVGGLEHLMRVGALFLLPIDRFDVSTYSTLRGAYYFEGFRGGIGVAKSMFSDWHTALRKGLEVAENCRCRRGCPDCIQPAKSYDISQKIDKTQGVELARLLLSRREAGPTHKWSGRLWERV